MFRPRKVVSSRRMLTSGLRCELECGHYKFLGKKRKAPETIDCPECAVVPIWEPRGQTSSDYREAILGRLISIGRYQEKLAEWLPMAHLVRRSWEVRGAFEALKPCLLPECIPHVSLALRFFRDAERIPYTNEEQAIVRAKTAFNEYVVQSAYLMSR